MNENKANYAKIGFFVLTGFGLILLSIGIAGARFLNRTEIYAETYIAESVTGLEIGSPVKYRGVPVGAVKRIGFVYSEYGDQMSVQEASLNAQQILVVMALNPKQFLPMQADDPNAFLDELIRKGLRVKVASQGITGLSYIEFDYLPTERMTDPNKQLVWTPKHSYIPSAPSTFLVFRQTTEDLMANLSQLDLQGITAEVIALLKTTREKVSGVDTAALSAEVIQLLGEWRSTTQSAQDLIDSLGAQKLPAELSETLASIRRITEQVDSQIEPLVASFKGVMATATNTGSQVSETLTTLNQTAQTLNRITGTQQHAFADLVQNLRATSESLSQLVADLQANPAALIFGQPPAPLPETQP